MTTNVSFADSFLIGEKNCVGIPTYTKGTLRRQEILWLRGHTAIEKRTSGRHAALSSRLHCPRGYAPRLVGEMRRPVRS